MVKFKSNKKHIDFNTLNPQQVEDLSKTWERDAFTFEVKLQSYMRQVGHQTSVDVEEKLTRLWTVGNALWKRLSYLENWKKKRK
jgi:hypothetical protein